MAAPQILNPTLSARGIRHHLVVRHDAFYPRCSHELLRLPAILGETVRRSVTQVVDPIVPLLTPVL